MNGRRRWPAAASLVALHLCISPAAPAGGRPAEAHPLLAVMQSELEFSLEKLIAPDGTRPYFLQYAVTDERQVYLAASLGALTAERLHHGRHLDVDVRCGDYTLDNTHQIRGGYWGGDDYWDTFGSSLPLDDDPLVTRHAIWLRTDEAFKAARKRLAQVRANLKVKVAEEDPSDDFSREEPVVHIGPWVSQPHDHARLVELVRRISRRFRSEPLIYSSRVTLSGEVTNKLVVNSEGSRLQHGRGWWRISIEAGTLAEDGMELWQQVTFDAHGPHGLPDEQELAAAADRVAAEVLALRDAPLVEPYTGPAILANRAAGVFFHEIFGHRIEGHRQKDVEEGQTFAKKLGEQVLPEFLSVIDDPTLKSFNGVELNGYYEFDDECVPAQRTCLVENGVLKTFLMSRSPTRGITRSNGHGRRQPGSKVVARMGNTMLESSRRVSFDELRRLLLEECRRQGKEFGLLFADISGGFTSTRRWSPQAFKVIPILVYRVYPDGRPDELVRGVDIVGTPLTSFASILATADDPAVFNGVCGAESGALPVAVISPSILVRQIEVEKRQKAQDRPPILEAPLAGKAQ